MEFSDKVLPNTKTCLKHLFPAQCPFHLVESLGLSHAGLDMETLDVLPMFLEERNQKVHGEADVLNELILSHLHVTNGHAQAKNLLHLELDGGLQIVHLRIQVIHMSYHGGELSSLVEARAQQSGDLLDQGVRAEEGIVALGQPLHLLLVLVELLQVISRHGGDIPLLGLVNVSLVSQQTNLEFPPGDMSQLDGATETFVLLWVVILQTDLEINALQEFPFFLG